MVLIVFVLQFGYFSIFEALWKGQTPGKRHQNLRLIKDFGQLITTYGAVARNLLRIVDGVPRLYAARILSALLSETEVWNICDNVAYFKSSKIVP